MKITTHPKELTRENVNSWLGTFVKKLKRTTTRNDLDRLILSVERMNFGSEEAGSWKKVIFKNGYLTYEATAEGYLERFSGEKRLTSFQQKILDENKDLQGKKIERSVLKEENGEWTLDPFSFHLLFEENFIFAGGEAVVMPVKFGELVIAARVQVFDPYLFTEKSDDVIFEIHLSKDFIAAGKSKDKAEKTIPFHENVIKNYVNIEIFASHDVKREDCLGWITLMEKCDSNLRNRLKDEYLGLEERKSIAIGVKNGQEYLSSIGLNHCDQKPENILLKNGEPRWTDFGLMTIDEFVDGKFDKECSHKMGYVRRGSKFYRFLYAGSAAFSDSYHLFDNFFNDTGSSLHIFILCDWKTAWSLLFNPIKKKEANEIRARLKDSGAKWLSKNIPTNEEIQQISKIISLEQTLPYLCLDDPNLTKSSVMAEIKQCLTKQMNSDFDFLTRNCLDQKDTNLCVPISISVILKWALDGLIFSFANVSLEEILIVLTMVIYPRSLAGLNLNPNKEEQDFQQNEVEILLKRLKLKTYLDESGWDIIFSEYIFDRESEFLKELNLNLHSVAFNYQQVLLHNYFIFERPLTVTGAFLDFDGNVIFHQMTIDRVENDQYVLQNTLHFHSAAQLRIFVQNCYYADNEMMKHCRQSDGTYVYHGQNGEFLHLANEKCGNMYQGEWYLLPQAYSITLTHIFEDSDGFYTIKGDYDSKCPEKKRIELSDLKD